MNLPFTNPLHLYRALLRETTYLFDHTARSWTQEYIKTSFRKHASKIHAGKRWQTVPIDANQIPSLNERQSLKRGRKFLILLQRANQGYQRQLRSLLQLSYGRKGRKKRELTTPFLRDGLQPVSVTAEAVKSGLLQAQALIPPVARFSQEWRAPENLLSLLNTQNQISSHLSIRKQIRLKPPVSETNKWGRPMPPSRVKNITKKWHAKMAAVFMPPIPEHEWARLKDIALRKEEFKLIPRRPMARRMQRDKENNELELAADKIVLGLQKPAGRKVMESIKNPHNMTTRFLSRFYAKHLLNHSPMAEPDPAGRGLVSKWDDGGRSCFPAAKPKNNTQAEALFG